MKKSKYNFFFDYSDDKVLAFNAFTKALAVLSKNEYKLISNIINNSNKNKSKSKKEKELINKLKNGGFLINNKDDEINDIKLASRMARFNTSYFGLTIAPTLNCNFNCPYCYEERKKVDMSLEVEKKLIEFVKEKTKYCRSFSVTWYGGEPLLRLKQIKRLTEKFRNICKENSCVYGPVKMITNGYLLTRKTAKELKELSVKGVQVTIDGPKDIHNKKRFLENGKGTFDTILNNIKDSIDILNIGIRINVDKNNKNRIIEAIHSIDDLGLKEKVNFYIAPITSYTDACLGVSKSCLKISEFSHYRASMYKKLSKEEYNVDKINYPKLQINGYCGATNINSFVVSPQGYLFKCWTEMAFSENLSVGNLLKKPFITHPERLRKWLLCEPFEDKECMSCKYLPICFGGCPYFNLYKKEKKCSLYKYNLEETLSIATLNWEKNEENKKFLRRLK